MTRRGEIAIGWRIVIARVAFAVAPDVSVSVTFTENEPVTVGLPDIRPPPVTVSPAGSPVADQV